MINKLWKFKENPSCEHCGVLEPFDAICDDGCGYCVTCIQNGGHIDDDGNIIEFTEEEFKQIEIKEITLKLKHFNKRIKELIKNLEKINDKS